MERKQSRMQRAEQRLQKLRDYNEYYKRIFMIIREFPIEVDFLLSHIT